MGDADQKNPYSQFSQEGPQRLFKDSSDLYIQRKRKSLDESIKRLDKVPYFIRTKQSENLKSLLTLQLEVMRQNMEYITTKGAPGYRNNDESTPQMVKLDAFFQDLSDLNVAGKSKQWPRATDAYDKAMTKLGEWKQLVEY